MEIKSLKLKDYRNYSDLNIEFYNGINVLYGDNGQGKTNILEAVYLFSSGRSHRLVKDKELIKFKSDFSEIVMNFTSQQREQISKINLFNNKNKKIFINGIEQKKVKALLGVFSTVIFSPEDLNLIKDGPENRRRFLDTDISQLKPKYNNYLRDYKKVLDLRNNLLKSENIDLTLLEVYTGKLVKLGAQIIIHRHLFIERLKESAKTIYKYISGKDEILDIRYVPYGSIYYEINKKSIEEALTKAFYEIKDKELYLKNTLTGPHRDDIDFYLDNKQAKSFSSQGQQRTIVLSLKLSEYNFIKDFLGEYPVLLLDDILSELDPKRQAKLLDFIKNSQTIITCTDKKIYESLKYPFKIYKVVAGHIE